MSIVFTKILEYDRRLATGQHNFAIMGSGKNFQMVFVWYEAINTSLRHSVSIERSRYSINETVAYKVIIQCSKLL